MDVSSFPILVAAIAGVTELLNRVRARDWWVVATILSAAVVGWLFGVTNYYPGLDPVEGVIAGFTASGVITTLGSLGKKSTAAPSLPLAKAK